MNDTDKIMAFVADNFAVTEYGATDKLCAAIELLASENEALREQNTMLDAKLAELDQQLKWAHHTPKLLTEADATADLAGVARPGAEPYAYAVHFPYEPREELVHDLDDLLDDLTSCTHSITPLYTAPPQASQPLTDEQWNRVSRAALEAFFECSRGSVTSQIDCAAHAAMRATEKAHGIGAAQKASQPAQDAADADMPLDKDGLAQLIAPMLYGTYHCTRVWEAWNVGTMSPDDFEPVDESDTPHEIADAILAAIAAQKGKP